ncbi:MAG: TauD/TfdA dioxygenase family protein [Acidimicrobiales bacterium]
MAATTETAASSAPTEAEMGRLFGADVEITALSAADRMGRRVRGIDLSRALTADQALCLVSLLDHHHIVSFPDQGRESFVLSDLERLANHFGAPIPHPSNYANYGAVDEPLRLKEPADRAHSLTNLAFPEDITCTEGADSAAVLVVTNLIGSGRAEEPQIQGGLHWHTDIEFEPEPLSTSMFYVQRTPIVAGDGTATWVTNPPREPGYYHPDSSQRLSELREVLPLNGETAYADTAAAYAELPEAEQERLETVMVRRRLRKRDPGWLVPLVYTNPRTGTKSLHSPVWASRGKRVAPAQIEGLNEDESREFLDRLEEHVLQPQFRYDHVHTPGDVTMWSNFATLHDAPPYKSSINTPDDARLMFRVSCKGRPSATLPRNDSDEWIAANLVPPYRTPLTSKDGSGSGGAGVA